VLLAKTALDEELRSYARGRLGETDIEVTELGAKDVILTGELANKVVEAERTGRQADPSPGGDCGNAFSAEHCTVDGGQSAPPAAQGT
jgi:hypothetical protein